jgi:hypothetical protein
MPPRFSIVSTAPKCKACNTTVYPQERVDYDQSTWHTTCFKCLECRSTLTMAAVAMINGQAYCKTCFKKIFLKEGRYSSFENRNSTSSPSPTASSPTAASSPTPTTATTTNADSESNNTTASVDAGSVTKENNEETKSSTSSPTASSRSSVSETVNTVASKEKTFDTPAMALKDAIMNKNRDEIRNLIKTNGINLIFEKNEKGLTFLESTLGHYEQKHMGIVMLEILQSQIQDANKLFSDNNIQSPFVATASN